MILKRLDDLGVAIDELTVDANEGVILGRGPLLKITDTKISRNHAKIIYDNEKQSLVFMNTGKKPCYIKQTKEEKEFSFVEKDECIEIGGGYIFGLLPDQYIYEINGWFKIEKNVSKVNSSKVEVIQDESDQEPNPGSSVDWERHKENLNSEMVEILKQKEVCEISEREKENKDESENRPSENKDENENRPSCLYGKIGCARKNPQHFREEAHPGDEDYIEIAQSSDNENEDKNDNDDRPECEYGLECYRKNPQHRKEYKHCRIERQAKRKAKEKAAKKKKAKNDDDEFDDSFIDDSEDDFSDITNDEESVEEWTPGHSDDE